MRKANLKTPLGEGLRHQSAILVLIVPFVLFSSSTVEAVKLEFDDVKSTGSVLMSVSVSAGPNSDSNRYQASGIFHNKAISTSTSGSGAWATAQSSVDCNAFSVYPPPWCPDIYSTVFEFVFDQDCAGNPYYYEDGQGNWITVPAAFSSNLEATGSIFWRLLPSEEDEDPNLPLIVRFGYFSPSVGSTSWNASYEMGIYDDRFGVEPNLCGPYHLIMRRPSGNSSNFPQQPDNDPNFLAVAHYADYFKLSYQINVNGSTISSSTFSGYRDSIYGPSIRLLHSIEVEPMEVFLLDKRRLREKNLLIPLQDREEGDDIEDDIEDVNAFVKGACSDGETQLVILFDPEEIFDDSENPSTVRLRVLSPYGKDTSFL